MNRAWMGMEGWEVREDRVLMDKMMKEREKKEYDFQVPDLGIYHSLGWECNRTIDVGVLDILRLRCE